jgi:hypothetical protein
MKFLSSQTIHPGGDSTLHNIKNFIIGEFSHQSKKTVNSLRFLPAKKIFHSNENQHFNLINVGFFLIHRKQTLLN